MIERKTWFSYLEFTVGLNFLMFYTYALWYGEYVDIPLMKQEKKRKNTSHIIQQQST